MKDRFAALEKKRAQAKGLFADDSVKIETDLDIDEMEYVSEKLQSDFTKRAKAEKLRFDNAVTLDYYVNVYFATPQQKALFLELFKVTENLLGGQFLSGQELCDAIGRVTGTVMPTFEKVEPPRPFRKSKQLSKFGDDDFI